MRQAIEEGFILDVLKNYTPYKLAFKLANNGKEWDEKEVERSVLETDGTITIPDTVDMGVRVAEDSVAAHSVN